MSGFSAKDTWCDCLHGGHLGHAEWRSFETKDVGKGLVGSGLMPEKERELPDAQRFSADF